MGIFDVMGPVMIGPSAPIPQGQPVLAIWPD